MCKTCKTAERKVLFPASPVFGLATPLGHCQMRRCSVSLRGMLGVRNLGKLPSICRGRSRPMGKLSKSIPVCKCHLDVILIGHLTMLTKKSLCGETKET